MFFDEPQRHIKFRRNNTDGSTSTTKTQSIERDGFLRPPTIGDGHCSRPSSSDSFMSYPETPASATSSAGSSRLSIAPSIYGGVRELSPNGQRADRSKRRSWFVRSKDEVEEYHGPSAWTSGPDEKIPYDLSDLLNGRLVTELWDPAGDCFVYLFSQESDKSPSFRVKSSLFISSRVMRTLMSNSQAIEDSASSTGLQNLHIPIARSSPPAGDGMSEETEALVAVRNLFAFLGGKPLVATQHRSSFFDIFVELSKLLTLYEFANSDGSTYGEVVTTSFNSYISELGLADVRTSDSKTIEGVVLGERMKSVKLYHEAFTHCAGKHDSVLGLGSPSFQLISPVSVNRLSRAAMELNKHTATVSRILDTLDFPSIFSGIMTSKSADERKYVDFDQWRVSFFAMRKHFLKFYKTHYKSWPPKATSKTTTGLNRKVLQEIYRDLCSVYDLLVDRSNISPTIAGDAPSDISSTMEARSSAIRQIFSEYDRSSPPVKPTIPFDLPMVPSLKTTQPDFGTGNEKKDAKAMSKRLKDDEIAKLLKASHCDTETVTPFAESFREFERKSAHSRNIREITERRVGYWIFIYAMLQILPILVVDAPELQYVEDVEYFLCQPPRLDVPWAKDDSMLVPSPGGLDIADADPIARLPADLVETGVEGSYRRSYCWIRAQEWTAGKPAILSAVQQRPMTIRPKSARPKSAIGIRESRNFSGSTRQSSTSTPSLLEDRPNTLQVPQLAIGNDSAKTFDEILASAADEGSIKSNKK